MQLEEPIAYRFTSYATLYAALVGFLEPGRYHLGQELTSVDDRGDGVRMSFRDGSTEDADLVVGADGSARPCVRCCSPVRPGYAGYVGWRGRWRPIVCPRRRARRSAGSSPTTSVIARTSSRTRSLTPRRATAGR